MAVFTSIPDAELRAWLDAAGVGAVHEITPTDGGIANSNWRVTAERGRFVFTLFESQPRDDAERTLALTARLADAGLPVAAPWPLQGHWTAPLAGKPAALAAWLDGAHPENPSRAQCAAIGRFLGRLHRVTRTSATEGTIHTDLFRDNALFDGDRLVGVIDFHYARDGALIDDVAAAALDWCWAGDGIDLALLTALGHAYHEVRPVGLGERDAFPGALRAAARRMLQGRLDDVRRTKDPEEMRARAAALDAHAPPFPRAGAVPA